MMKRWWTRSVLAIGVVVGLVLSTAQPALADVYWQTYTLTSKWHCTERLSSPTSIADVRVCVVVNGNYAQAVTTVRNTTSDFIDINGYYTNLYVAGEQEDFGRCNLSALGAGLQRACFGRTISSPCGISVWAYTQTGVRRDRNYAFSWVTGNTLTWEYCT
jgi:hypothetical protein